ncbi:MAG: 50S ribosomal protein L23 [Candidatus Falkowbacteria bacterium GW2011_GWF2_43_32]|nr:MAG: 50S ribosomal protein L23 [Candidatus Falkowbacteria bacterium GW2011_GWF2_43_32]
MSLFGSKKTGDVVNKPQTEEKKSATSMRDLYSDAAVSATSGGQAKTVAGAVASAATVLVKPLVTEKATNLNAANKYVFVVDNGANVIAVAKAIQTVYGVKPVKVNIMNVSGKRTVRGRISGQRKDWRKAVVTLPPGKTIQIYEGV